MAQPWLPDWRDPEAYRFEKLDRAGFAWEWLRRDPAYREAAQRGLADGEAVRWGLVRFEPPDRCAPDARSIWCAATDCTVLSADALAPGPGEADVFDPWRFGGLLTSVEGGGIVHVLLTDGWRRLRIDLHGGDLSGFPIVPHWRLAGLRLQSQLRSVTSLASLAASGRFADRLWPPDPRARRWILALRAHDALAAGMSHRAIAELLGAQTGEARWRAREPSLRLQAQRIAALARQLRGLGFAHRYLSDSAADSAHSSV